MTDQISMSKTLVKEILSSLLESDLTIVAGKSTPWPNDNAPPAITSSIQDENEVWRNMIYGVQLNQDNMRFIVDRIGWSSGTVYDQYHMNQKDGDQFYVINSANSVFKCLYNNKGGASTSEPQSTGIFTTADGYKWLYLFTISNDELNKFGTNEFIPVPFDTITPLSSVGGIEVINVNASSDDWISANGVIVSTSGNNTIRLSDNASSVTNLYKNSSILVENTSYQALFDITSSYANTTGKYATVSQNMSTSGGIPPLGSTYKISPSVKISGDAYTNAKAYSTVINGRIDTINILDSGIGYTYANVTCTTAQNYGSSVTAEAIISPRNGHGASYALDLRCQRLAIYAEFPPTTGADFPNSNLSYRQVTLVKDLSQRDYPAIGSYRFTTRFNCATTFQVGETIRGVVSGSVGTVVRSSGGVTHINNIRDGYDFDVGETWTTGEEVIGSVTAISSPISNIVQRNTITLDATAKILYHVNIIPINRQADVSDKVRFIIDLKDV